MSNYKEEIRERACSSSDLKKLKEFTPRHIMRARVGINVRHDETVKKLNSKVKGIRWRKDTNNLSNK